MCVVNRIVEYTACPKSCWCVIAVEVFILRGIFVDIIEERWRNIAGGFEITSKAFWIVEIVQRYVFVVAFGIEKDKSVQHTNRLVRAGGRVQFFILALAFKYRRSRLLHIPHRRSI